MKLKYPHPVFATIVYAIFLLMVFMSAEPKKLSRLKIYTLLGLIPWGFGYWGSISLYLKKSLITSWFRVVLYYAPLVLWVISPTWSILFYLIQIGWREFWKNVDIYKFSQFIFMMIILFLLKSLLCTRKNKKNKRNRRKRRN